MPLAKIVYASMTGNTEEIAEIAAEALEKCGAEVEVLDCTQANAEVFKTADICVIAVYTDGDGEIPDQIIELYEELQTLDLTGKIFGVCGSGDTFYTRYCQSVDDFEAVFAKTGAEKGAESVKVNLAAEEDDIEHLEFFAKKLADAVK